MRPIFALLLSVSILSVVGGYSWFRQQGRVPPAATHTKHKRLLVCSTTQVADFARQVVGDRWQVRSILAAGQDPHMYEIKTGDAELVSRADLCAENGWHLEGHEWMSRLAKNAGKRLVTCVNGIEPLRLEEDGEQINDPHAWFTPANARVFVRNLTAGVVSMDPDHRAEYEARAALYEQQLDLLQRFIEEQVRRIPADQRILVTSHDAFNYYCRQFGFQSRAPAGWSTGDEAGAGVTSERRQQVVDSIRQFGVKAIFVETSVNRKLLDVIADEAGVKIGGELYSDSMGEIGSGGETYIGMMRENTLTIVEALK